MAYGLLARVLPYTVICTVNLSNVFFLIENQGLGEIEKVYFCGKGRIRNTVLKFKL
tara:strand:+ start:64 stop:231 length:168 start_codon:yes stop_codon:yes gene_type:complete